jgi:FkbM family methyltransferase
MEGTSTSSHHNTGRAHHTSILAQPPVTMWCPPEIIVDFIGSRTRRSYDAGLGIRREFARVAEVVTPQYPAFDEEYFEWIDLLEAVEEATDTFVMMELGAGFGRWSMRAALAVRRKAGCHFHSVAVEAEPIHFRWMLDHFKDNDVNPVEHELIWAAVGATEGFAPFKIGEPSSWYGQSVAKAPREPLPDPQVRRRLKARSILGRPPAPATEKRGVMWVPCVTLNELIAPYPRVDLIDIDVQGHEVQVLEPAMALLNERVRRVHIGTHSTEIEAALREVFNAEGWRKLNDYPCQSRVSTPFGEIAFGDGVQTWLNPVLSARRSSGAKARGARRPSTESPEASAALQARVADLKERNRQLKAEAVQRSAESREAAAAGESPNIVEELRTRVEELKERNLQLKAEIVSLREKHRDHKAQTQSAAATRWWKRLVPGWLARLVNG